MYWQFFTLTKPYTMTLINYKRHPTKTPSESSTGSYLVIRRREVISCWGGLCTLGGTLARTIPLETLVSQKHVVQVIINPQ